MKKKLRLIYENFCSTSPRSSTLNEAQNERDKCMKKKVPLGEIHLEGSLSKGA